MNIVIDLRSLQSGKVSGVEVYAEALIRHLSPKLPEAQIFLWTNSNKKPLPENFPEFSFPNVQRLHTTFSNFAFTLQAALFRRPQLDVLLTRILQKKGLLAMGEKIDVLLLPDPRPAPVSAHCAKITLFHDLSPLHFPQSFSPRTRLWQRFVRLKKEAEESAAILTPSRFTKEDLEKNFGIDVEKISVIGAGAAAHLHPVTDPLELDAVRAKYNLPQEFFLTLSTLEPRKNLPTLIEAFQRFRQKTQSQMKLVIAGVAHPELFAALDFPVQDGLIFPGFIAEADKAALYSAATAFIAPSLFEGFGLPVLEAMTCGATVLASHAAALPEVYGDAALSFDPHDIGELARTLETIFLSPDLQRELGEKALERARCPQFSWETVAEKTVEILRQQSIKY